MATQYAFGQIVTSGLVLSLDAADKNSYPGSGTTWSDLTGGGSNGALTNGPTFSTAAGGAINFDGTNDSVEVTGNFGTLSQYTVEHFSYYTVPNRMPVSYRTNTSFYQYGDNSWFYTHGGVTGEYYYPTTFAISGWGHWAITYTGANVRIYRNSIYQGQQATTGTANWTAGLKIGYWSAGGGYAWSGPIAIVRFYNRALSDGEVQQNFNAQRFRFGI